MEDPNATLGAVVPVVMPTTYCALGQVTVAGLWSERRAPMRFWRRDLRPASRGWQDRRAPGERSGRF